MVWPFGSSGAAAQPPPTVSSQVDMQSASMTDIATPVMSSDMAVSDINSTMSTDTDASSRTGFDKAPVFALDQLKQAGVPFEKQLSPYLQMDPTVFRESTPQYALFFLYLYTSHMLLHFFFLLQSLFSL